VFRFLYLAPSAYLSASRISTLPHSWPPSRPQKSDPKFILYLPHLTRIDLLCLMR
jgi:hypothetical protein